MSRPRPSAPHPIEADPRWLALLAREAAADGSFVYGVRTTGVYCRPSCASRRPRPENVTLFATLAAAEEAGFRPCRRCTPERPSLAERRAAVVADLCRAIEASEEPLSVADLAERAGWSPSHLHRVFRAVTGVTPKAYVEGRRAEEVRARLERGESVTAALYGAGYGSSSRFYAQAEGHLGMRPSAYRQGGPGERIRFALGETRLGSILVAASQQGVCAVSLGDRPEPLLAELEERFPRAELIGAEDEFEDHVARVVGLVERPAEPVTLPLDLRGTTFQLRVWAALRQIPPGERRSYSELAASLDPPSGPRAVARACAQNPLALVIPCHRVVRRDGGLAGYRWGIERKRALLAREAEGKSLP